MFIEPNTTIKILRSVDLDNSYKDTILFSNKYEQSAYFSEFTKHTLNNQTYQRVNKGIARVGIKVEALYDCNYMMFQNTNFGDKWFYAFINKVDYINNTVSEITYEIDVMQTWLFDYELRDCFVEREHASTDVAGDNLVPEKLDTGEYITDDFDGTNLLSHYKILVATSYDKEMTEWYSCSIAGVFHGYTFIWFDTKLEFDKWYGDLSQDEAKKDGVHAVLMFPEKFCIDLLKEPTNAVKSYELIKTKQLVQIDGYIPRNNKLFTHPYNFLYVSNLEGLQAEYPYEYFDSTTCNFTIAGDMSCNPSIVMYPMNYKGAPANIDEKLTLTNFPMCAWSSDSFQAWLAQNSGTLASQVLTGAISTAASYAVNPVFGIVTGVSKISSLAGEVYDRSRQPRQVHGVAGSSTQVALGIKDFAFYHKHITREFAEIIDRFFSMFGYATHKVKTPNINNRKLWNYIKTVDCNCYGSLPSDDMKKIKSIYENGITFWHVNRGATIGKYVDEYGYLLDNAIMGAEPLPTP
jgi:hypothetical protein